jgi:hypothetical protein
VSGVWPVVPVPVAASAVQLSFPGGCEGFCQFGNESVQVVAGDAGEDSMGQGRTGLFDRHTSETVRPATVSIKPTRRVASTHHYCSQGRNHAGPFGVRVSGRVARSVNPPMWTVAADRVRRAGRAVRPESRLPARRGCCRCAGEDLMNLAWVEMSEKIGDTDGITDSDLVIEEEMYDLMQGDVVTLPAGGSDGGGDVVDRVGLDAHPAWCAGGQVEREQDELPAALSGKGIDKDVEVEWIRHVQLSDLGRAALSNFA